VVEGGEHGREGGPDPAPRGGPVQALRRGGPQLVARALQRQRPRPLRALGRGGRDHGGVPTRARWRRCGAARAGARDPVRDRRHVMSRCSAGLLIGAVAGARAWALCLRGNASRGVLPVRVGRWVLV
jgi:hypothetical protein